MNLFSDAKIIESSSKNASAWGTAVREGQIESRTLVTNRAIVDVVLSRSPHSVLDLGCGEGWLARELAANAIDVIGIDVVPGLIERVRSAGIGTFHVASYEELAADKLEIAADVVVCNFALLGNESVKDVFRSVPSMLNIHGSFIVQTLHPVVVCDDFPYRDGWREGSWDGFSSDFNRPSPVVLSDHRKLENSVRRERVPPA